MFDNLVMKFRFEPNLDYQLQAIEAVCGLFLGHDVCGTEFTVTPSLWNPKSGSFVAKTNLAAILEQHGLGNVRSL